MLQLGTTVRRTRSHIALCRLTSSSAWLSRVSARAALSANNRRLPRVFTEHCLSRVEWISFALPQLCRLPCRMRFRLLHCNGPILSLHSHPKVHLRPLHRLIHLACSRRPKLPGILLWSLRQRIVPRRHTSPLMHSSRTYGTNSHARHQSNGGSIQFRCINHLRRLLRVGARVCRRRCSTATLGIKFRRSRNMRPSSCVRMHLPFRRQSTIRCRVADVAVVARVTRPGTKMRTAVATEMSKMKSRTVNRAHAAHGQFPTRGIQTLATQSALRRLALRQRLCPDEQRRAVADEDPVL